MKISSAIEKKLLIATIFLCYTGATAQWVQTSGPYGGGLSALTVDSPFIFTGADYAGVYKSSDNGFHWNRVTNGLTSLRVMSLIKVSGNLFAGMDVNGIFLSINNGASWTQLTNGLPPSASTVVFCFAANGNIVYAGTNHGIFMTSNFGASWTPINNGIVNLEIHSIIASGTEMFTTTLDGVYYSNNSGANWTSVSNGLNNNQMGQLAMIDTILFSSALWNDTLFISYNKGNIWSPILFSTNYGWTTSLFVDSGKIYAGTNWDWIYVSADTGQTWQHLTNGILHSGIGQISKIGPNLIISTGGGIYQSANGGLNWIKTDTNLAATYVEDLFMDGSNLFAACNGNGVSVSSDGGNSWSVPNASIGTIGSLSVVVKNNDVFTGSGNTGILYSSDYGVNWMPVNNGISTLANYSSMVATSNGILATAGRLYYTTNNGISWSQLNSGFNDFNRYCLAIEGDNVLTGSNNENIYRSTDGGMNWTQVYNGTLTFNSINQIDISGNFVVAGSQQGILVSSDSGNTWNFANNGLTDGRCLSVAILGVNLWAGTYSGVFFSNDFGANWSYYHTGLDTLQWLFSLELDSNYIYGGGRSSGVWKRSLSDFPLSTSENLNSFADNSLLLFPNPAGSAVHIKSIWSNIEKIEVFNFLGEKKYSQVLNKKEETIDTRQFSPGVYLVKITDGSRTFAKKLIVQ